MGNGGWTANGQMLMELITSDGNQSPSVLGGVFRAGLITELSSPSIVPRVTWIISDYTDFSDSFNRFRDSVSNHVYREQITESYNNILNMYDESFFEDRSLAIVYIFAQSIHHNIEYSYSNISDNTVTVAYTIREPNVIPGISCGFFIILEVDKTVTSIEANRTIIPGEPAPLPPHMRP